MTTCIHQTIQQRLADHFTDINEASFTSIGGGCINETYRLGTSSYQVFCKINSAVKFPQLFEKEKQGLELIREQDLIKTPGVIDCFETDGTQVLLLEWVNEGERTDRFWKRFGKELAALHQISNEKFGLANDNYMGSVPQKNLPVTSWIDFFINQRLEPLLLQCLEKNLLKAKHRDQFQVLYKVLPSVFDGEQKPALLHGDLWSGNFMCDDQGAPVLIDPAVYFGHPSVDLAMTSLFGGFRNGFYEAYHYHAPLPSNYEEQWKVCNLYPLLIHLLLFGSSYLPQIESTLNTFI